LGLIPLVQRGFKGLFDRNKTSFRSPFMPVVVHRTVVPCERMALVPFPHKDISVKVVNMELEFSFSVNYFGTVQL
jgi:hypothetical protein